MFTLKIEKDQNFSLDQKFIAGINLIFSELGTKIAFLRRFIEQFR